MSIPVNFSNTCAAMAGGTPAGSGQGEEWALTVSGSWVNGDLYTVDLTDAVTGILTQVGAGFATGVQPTYIKTFKGKVYALAGSAAYFSGEQEPTSWNNPNDLTNGFITLSDWWSTSENLQGMSPFQGNVAFVGRQDCQIWSVDPDTQNYALIQVLPNIGTFCGNTVQPIGDMDVYMVYDVGVRSLRVRVATNNAMVAGIGEPIDAIIQPIISRMTTNQKAACCSTVDPAANRYWVFFPDSTDPDNGIGKIWTFSQFPSSQVEAWSSYSPTYQAAVSAPGANYPGSAPITLTYSGLTIGKRYAWVPGAHEVSITCGSVTLAKAGVNGGVGAFVATATTAVVTGTAINASFTGSLTVTTPFQPQNFVILAGQVWVRDTANNFYQFGGSNNTTYDNCGITANTPFIDSGSPGQWKMFDGIDAGFQGFWSIGMVADYNTQSYKTVYNNNLPSFLYQKIGWEATGTHFSGQLQENGNGYALFSNLIVHVKKANEK